MKRWISRILIATFVGLAAYGVWVFIQGEAGRANRNSHLLRASGRIEGQEYHASSKIGGRIEELFVEEGDAVEPGQKVAHISSPQLEAMMEQAQAQLRKAEANFKLAELEFQRYERLLKEDAVPKASFDVVENRYTLAREEIVTAKKELEKLQADLEDATITAPVAGRVLSKIVRAGEVVSAGTPVVSIINLDDLHLKVFLTTEESGKVMLGQKARVFPDAFPKEPFEAAVERIAERAEFTPKHVETKSQRAKLVFEVKLKIKENKDHKLKAGMPAEAVIDLQ